MERDDIQALRRSVDLLRGGNDDLVTMARSGPQVMTARSRDELRAAAHHIDEMLSRGETVAGNGFEIVNRPQ